MTAERDTSRKRLGLVALVTVLWMTLSFQNQALRHLRAETLPETTAYAPEAPAWMNLLAVSLGGFRGLATSLLWVRVSILQEQGRFVELMTLSDWITQLDPHAAEAWSHHAWNLSYNVSAMLRHPEDRLRWVDAGIELLRDRGLRLNPRSAHLHRELGWIYQHKIGAESDAAHLTYKRALARRMAPLLTATGGAPAPGSPEATQLKERFRLDAIRMHALENRFGALDWRIAETHTLYWAVAGLQFFDPREDLQLHRMVYQALRALLRHGKLVSLPDDAGDVPPYARAPNLAVIPGTLAFFEETLERYPLPSITEPFGGFLVEAIRALDAANRNDDMQALYNRLVELLDPESPPSLTSLLRTDPDSG